MITERLMQFIWQFQYFNATNLETVSGENMQVIHPGRLNTHQGPDFSDARIKIGETVWAGNIELHVYPGDWQRHSHDQDVNYQRVILHVVWFNRESTGAVQMPMLALEHRIPGLLLEQYQAWMLGVGDRFIPCGHGAGTVNTLHWTGWKERLLVERWKRKYGVIMGMLQHNRHHWEETTWWLLARYLGGAVNGDAFEEIARSLPYALMARHRLQLHQLEALLMGQAGLLAGSYEDDDYFRMLQNEYAFYRRKYGLNPVHVPVHFLRMRPASFPTLRLAQLAKLMHVSGNILSEFLEAKTLAELRHVLHITVGGYWTDHYRFGHRSSGREKMPGRQAVDGLLINVVAPLVFSYGKYYGREGLKEKALGWMSEMTGENNSVMRGFALLGVTADNAASSQALLELKTQYCDQRRCLDCAIGNSILKRGVR